MARPMSAWWQSPLMRVTPESESLLLRFRPMIEHAIYTYSRRYPGDVDWDTVVWDAAYRTAFRVESQAGFVDLFKTILWKRAANFVARHARRRAKLTRQPMACLESLTW